MKAVDMHTHTTASDGVHSPGANVRLAKEAGLAGIAVTDHDTVAGIAEAVREGERLGIAVIPGVEISTVDNGLDIHVLGYGMRCDDSLFLSRLEELRSVRNVRNRMMLEKLTQLGFSLSLEELNAFAQANKGGRETIGRPHIAEWMVQKGYVNNVKEAFDRYLGSQGSAYVNPPRIPPETAVAWIRQAGGRAVLAHPGLYGRDELIPRLAEAGLDGLEVRHSDHSEADEARYGRQCEQYGLTATAGSDYHGERQGEAFHGPIGSRTMALQDAQDFLRR